MDTCVRCGAELGVGRFCLNCGHRIGAPAPVEPVSPTGPAAAPTEPAPTTRSVLPTSAARPTPDSEWDPREDLLPLEEVDDVERDAPLRGRAWIAWVLGAVALIGLALFLLRAFAADPVADDDTAVDGAVEATSADAPGAEATAEGEAPRGVGRRIDLAATATYAVPATAEPTTDFDGTLVAYEASQLADDDTSTAWRMGGDATGQSVTLTLAEPGVVQRVGIVNGYAKQVAGVNWYPNNRRILSVTWAFDDGASVEQTLTERPRMQRLKVPPVQTGTVTVTMTSVTPPGTGSLGRDYTAISEIEVIGRRAG